MLQFVDKSDQIVVMKFSGLSRQCSFVLFAVKIENSLWFNSIIRTTRACHRIRVNSCQNFSTSGRVLYAKKKSNFNKPKSTELHQVDRKLLDMAGLQLKEQYFDYFLVLDFEATCKANEQIHPQVNMFCFKL